MRTTITIPDNTTISGEGCVIRAHDLLIVFELGGSTGVTIKDLIIDGGNTCSRAVAVSAAEANSLTLRDCELRKFRASAFRSSLAVNGLILVDNYVHNIGGEGVVTGFSPNFAYNCEIFGNRIETIGDNAGDWAVYISSAGEQLNIHHNIIQDCIGGIKVSIGSGTQPDATLDANEISTTEQAGIVVGRVTLATVSNNHVIAPRTGINIEATVRSVFIMGGEVTITTDEVGDSFGIILGDGAIDVTIDSVTLRRDNDTYGFGIAMREVDGVLIRNCHIAGFLYPIGQYSSQYLTNVRIEDCRLVGAGSTGAGLSFKYVDGLYASRNIVADVQFFLNLEGTPHVSNTEIAENVIKSYCQNWGRVTGAIAVYIHDNVSYAPIPDDWFDISGNVTLESNTVFP